MPQPRISREIFDMLGVGDYIEYIHPKEGSFRTEQITSVKKNKIIVTDAVGRETTLTVANITKVVQYQ